MTLCINVPVVGEDATIKLDRAQRTIDHLIKNGAVVKYEILDQAGHNLNSAPYAKVLHWLAADLHGKPAGTPAKL